MNRKLIIKIKLDAKIMILKLTEAVNKTTIAIEDMAKALGKLKIKRNRYGKFNKSS